MLAHPSCINVIAQSMGTENVKTKIQGKLITGGGGGGATSHTFY